MPVTALVNEHIGAWLLFTDADTQHSPQSIALGVAQAQTLGVDLLSAFPAQTTKSWSERIFVSFIVDFLPLVGLNFRAISQGKGNHSAATGNIYWRAPPLIAVAGAMPRSTMKRWTILQLPSTFAWVASKLGWWMAKNFCNVACITTRDEVWEGFSRSMMHGLDNSTLQSHSWLWALLFAWGYAALFLHPFYYLSVGEHQTLALLELAWLALFRGIATWHLRRSPLEVLTTPLAAWGVMALGMAALYRRRQGQKVNWKGRYYTG